LFDLSSRPAICDCVLRTEPTLIYILNHLSSILNQLTEPTAETSIIVHSELCAPSPTHVHAGTRRSVCRLPQAASSCCLKLPQAPTAQSPTLLSVFKVTLPPQPRHAAESSGATNVAGTTPLAVLIWTMTLLEAVGACERHRPKAKLERRACALALYNHPVSGMQMRPTPARPRPIDSVGELPIAVAMSDDSASASCSQSQPLPDGHVKRHCA